MMDTWEVLESSVQSTRLEFYYGFLSKDHLYSVLKKNMDILEPNFQDQKKLDWNSSPVKS